MVLPVHDCPMQYLFPIKSSITVLTLTGFPCPFSELPRMKVKTAVKHEIASDRDPQGLTVRRSIPMMETKVGFPGNVDFLVGL